MIASSEGLTDTYNRFHDPEESTQSILDLRELHELMDRAVLDAYGWIDIKPKCEFIPEFDDEDEEDETGRTHKKKYRYRWPDEVRDEVLARLLELNRQRSLEEGQLLPSAPGPTAPPKKNGNTKKRKAPSQPKAVASLFAAQNGEE